MQKEIRKNQTAATAERNATTVPAATADAGTTAVTTTAITTAATKTAKTTAETATTTQAAGRTKRKTTTCSQLRTVAVLMLVLAGGQI